MKHLRDTNAPERTGPPGKTLSSVKPPSSAKEAAQYLNPSLHSTARTFRWAAGVSHLIPDSAQPLRYFSTNMGVYTNQSDQSADTLLETDEESRVAIELAVTGSRVLNDYHRQMVSAINHTGMTRDEGYGFIQGLLPRIQGKGTVPDHQQEFQEVISELDSFIGAAWKKTLEAEPSTVYQKYMPDSWVREELSGGALDASRNLESAAASIPRTENKDAVC